MKKSLIKSSLICIMACLSLSLIVYAAPFKRLPEPIKWPSKPKILKMKLYQGDTIAIIWYNFKGDSRCDGAEIIYKEDGYFVVKKINCKQADEIDQYILEPRI